VVARVERGRAAAQKAAEEAAEVASVMVAAKVGRVAMPVEENQAEGKVAEENQAEGKVELDP
jgi:hypothetical protein